MEPFNAKMKIFENKWVYENKCKRIRLTWKSK
jgi:hypothetical protein